MIRIAAEIDLSNLAESITDDFRMTRNNYAYLLDFIKEIDNNVNDIQFTIALYDLLGEVIEAELS